MLPGSGIGMAAIIPALASAGRNYGDIGDNQNDQDNNEKDEENLTGAESSPDSGLSSGASADLLHLESLDLLDRIRSRSLHTPPLGHVEIELSLLQRTHGRPPHLTSVQEGRIVVK